MRTRTKISNSSGIYQIRSKINGKIYVGSAMCIKKRWGVHLLALKKNINSRHLQNHVNKYGVDDLQFSIIEFCPKEKLLEREQYWINTLQPQFNLAKIAGSNMGVKFSEETKRKISESQKGKIIPQEQRKQIAQTLKGNIPWNKGLPMLEETKSKLSQSLKGRLAWNKGTQLSEEGKLKLSIAHKGQIRTEEQKKKTSETIKKTIAEKGDHWNVGYCHTEDSKQKIAKYQKGRVRSDETRNKISLAKMGHIVTSETRDKISKTKMSKLHKVA